MRANTQISLILHHNRFSGVCFSFYFSCTFQGPSGGIGSNGEPGEPGVPGVQVCQYHFCLVSHDHVSTIKEDIVIQQREKQTVCVLVFMLA